MRALRRHLFEGESIVTRTRLHAGALLGPALGLVAALGASAGVALYLGVNEPAALAALGALPGLAALRLILRTLQWRRRWLVITNARLIEVSGVLRRRFSSLLLQNVSEVRCRRPLLGKLIGSGEMSVVSSGRVRRIGPLAGPERIDRLVTEAMGRPRLQRTSAPPIATKKYTPLDNRFEPASLRRGVAVPIVAEAASRVPSASVGDGLVVDGRYQLIRRLASGGMGSVYEALDERLGRRVAVKLIREGLDDDSRLIERFRQEARSIAALSHPCIASIFDYGEHQGLPYIVMELIRGESLERKLEREGSFAPMLACRIASQMLRALEQAHVVGIVHRDVKPSNVLVSDGEEVKVTDFGIALVAGQTRLTSTGMILGSAYYVSPEQVHGELATERSDVYAAGVMLFEMLTGAPPYHGGSLVRVAHRHVHERVPPPSTRAAHVPRALDQIVVRATERDPQRRFASASDMDAALRRVMYPSDIPAVGSARRRTLRLSRSGPRDTPPLPRLSS